MARVGAQRLLRPAARRRNVLHSAPQRNGKYQNVSPIHADVRVKRDSKTKGSPRTMRLVTRSDFDGLICAVLLKQVEKIDSIQFVHPKDLQDGKFAATADDILANVPYVPG